MFLKQDHCEWIQHLSFQLDQSDTDDSGQAAQQGILGCGLINLILRTDEETDHCSLIAGPRCTCESMNVYFNFCLF